MYLSVRNARIFRIEDTVGISRIKISGEDRSEGGSDVDSCEACFEHKKPPALKMNFTNRDGIVLL